MRISARQLNGTDRDPHEDRDAHAVGEWPQGRNPHRRKIGVLGWSPLILFLLVPVLRGAALTHRATKTDTAARRP